MAPIQTNSDYNGFPKMLIVTILVFFMPQVENLIGFDCAHKTINVTTIATDSVPGCKVENKESTPMEEIIQLIQIADKYPLHVYQCKVTITRSITYCGMHSHSSAVRGGLAEYIRPITQHECLDIHTHRYMQINRVMIDGIQPNASTSRSVVLAGDIGYDGSCKGESYNDPFGSWSSVIVQGMVTLTITDYTATADTTSDKIHLRSGVTCLTSSGECIDIEQGFTTWTSDKITRCDERKHMVLYEGPSVKYLTMSKNGHSTTTYMVDNTDKVFGLRILNTYEGCMFKAFSTEHPKLIIVPHQGGPFFFTKKALNPSSLDLMAYVNSKFVFAEKVHNRNMKELYNLLTTQRCMVERRNLQTLLSLANINPQEFAYTYMNQPGYTALKLGEVVHIIQCSPVNVVIRPTNHCYHELPVVYEGKPMFLTPRSRLLQSYGTEVDCDNVVNAQFRIDNTWYAIGKIRHLVPSPKELTPSPMLDWEPQSIHNLARSGIYTYQEAEQLRERVMNPYEKEAINNILVRGVSGKTFERQGVTLTDLVDDNMVEDLGHQVTEKIWGYFTIFGNISAGFIGLYFTLKLVKFAFDTLLHCKAIYDLYGLSLALIGGVWDSLTNYLIHRKAYNDYRKPSYDVKKEGETIIHIPSAPSEQEDNPENEHLNNKASMAQGPSSNGQDVNMMMGITEFPKKYPTISSPGFMP